MTDDPATAMWHYIGMAVLLLLNGLISMAYCSVTTVGDARLAKLCEDGERRAVRIKKWLDRGARLTEAVRFCQVLLAFGAVTLTWQAWYTPLVAAMTPMLLPTAAATVSSIVIVAATAAVWLVVSEWLPRRLAAKNAESTALAMGGFLSALLTVTTPLYVPLSWLVGAVARLFGAQAHADEEDVTEEDIRLLVDVGEEQGVIEGSQKEMINNIFEFDNLTAADIMTPRIDVVAAEADDSIDVVLSDAVGGGVSRMPVYDADIDHVIGVLYIKDLLPYVGKPLPEEVTVLSMLREPLFVPQTKKCGELFSEMTALHTQMAMVVDEYGGIAGIVTMEDLLEAIVGNMQDEYDNEQDEVTQLDDTHYTVEGTMDIEQLGELLSMTIPEGDYETLGGFLMSHMGRVPAEHEHPCVTFENVVFTVLSMDDRRIEKVHIEVLPVADEEPQKS